MSSFSRVDLDWIVDSINSDTSISIRHMRTTEQLADMLTTRYVRYHSMEVFDAVVRHSLTNHSFSESSCSAASLKYLSRCRTHASLLAISTVDRGKRRTNRFIKALQGSSKGQASQRKLISKPCGKLRKNCCLCQKLTPEKATTSSAWEHECPDVH